MNFTFDLLLARALVILTAIPIHEFAHAYAASKMGDPTARRSNRLTLNPFHHIDPVGALMIMFFGIGFAKPVPINSYNFRNRKKGIIVTSIAGPLSNVLVAVVCLALFKIIIGLAGLTGLGLLGWIAYILLDMVFINISLAIFNMLPIPPLDGWNVLAQFLPSDIYWKISQHSNILIFVVLMLVYSNILDGPLIFLTQILFTVIDKITFVFDLLFIFF